MYSSWSLTRLRRAVVLSDRAAWCGQPRHTAGSQAPSEQAACMTAARKRWETMQGEAAAVRTATGLRMEVECIDVLPKPSASKA
jgi:hypothetical protein